MDRPEPPESWATLPFFCEQDANGTTAWDRVWTKLEAETEAGRVWQPAPENIFRALALTPRNNVRVVILGQDPYETPGRATGLAFELGEGHASSQSYKGIRAELRRELTEPTLGFPNLKDWAQQGVLLLNSALTVQVGRAGRHSTIGWKEFTNCILNCLYQNPRITFCLWGKAAIQIGRDAGLCLTDQRVFVSGHPRGGMPPNINGLDAVHRFKGSKPFSKANQLLRDQGACEINWGKPNDPAT